MSDRHGERSASDRVPVDDLLRSAVEPMPADASERVRAKVVAAGVASNPIAARHRRVHAGVAAVLVACALTTAGVGFAAQNALPGDALYPVKRATERMRIVFVPADERADAYLMQADERIREIERLLNAGASARALNEAVEAFCEATRRAIETEPDEASAQRKIDEIRQHVDEAPPAVRDVIESALEEADMAPDPTPPVSPGIPPVKPDSDEPEGGGPPLSEELHLPDPPDPGPPPGEFGVESLPIPKPDSDE